MEKLPNCILSEIFVRVKAKQLAQMRTVSKPWNALLSHSSFIKHHLNHSLHQNNDGILLLIMGSFSFGSKKKKPFKLCSSQYPDLEVANFIKLPANLSCKWGHGNFIGSVHGLICFTYSSNHEFHGIYYIWNPSLSALLTLPPYSIPSEISWISCMRISNYHRFGFDPTSNDYKVVNFTGIFAPNTVVVAEWLQVKVYSMRRGTWELITQKIPSHLSHIDNRDLVCADGHNGHLHWLAWITLGIISSQRILAFDLGADTFSEIPLPDALLDETVYNIPNVLGVFTGKLCVMAGFQANVSTKVELWLMDEHGVAESWVKLHVFSLFSNINPIGFISQREFLFGDSNGDMALFDSFAATTKLFKFCGFRRGYKRLVRVVPYVDSLVWVSPSSCCSISQVQF